MKKAMVAGFLCLTLFLLLPAGCSAETTGNETEAETQETAGTQTVETDTPDYGAKGALEKDSFTVEEMLRYAIEDEYLARQEYESIIEKFGEINPFRNIMSAEETHIALLKEIYQTYQYEVPEDHAIDYITVPDSVSQALELGVQAEIDNIGMYELFLQQDLPDDVRDTFIRLRDASTNHLAAFERGTD